MTSSTDYEHFFAYRFSRDFTVTKGFNCCFSGANSESTSMKRENSCSRKPALMMRMVLKKANAKFTQVFKRLFKI